MAARRRTSRRKTAAPRRRSPKPMVNVFNAAQSYVLANAALQATMGVSPVEFVTGRINGQFKPGSDGYQQVTLPELLGFSSSGWDASAIGGNYGSSKTFMDAVQYNLKNNGSAAIATLILAPVGFKLARKVLQRPLLTPANRLLKTAGLNSIVKV
jgi:hypothetical protein